MTYPQQIIPTEPDSGSTYVHSNSTITASGSIVMTGVGSKEVTLVVNVTAAPTGTTPTLTYSLQEVDPGDQTAVFGPISSTPSISAIGVYTAALGSTVGGAVKISWVVTGAGASFTGVYATASSKVGTASTPAGAVIVSDASIGPNNAAAPASSSQMGGSDGTNLQSVRVFDADSGAGSQYVLGAVLRKSAAGGSVETGTLSDPLRVDPTGTTTQPISAASLPLPTGAATEATLATRLAEATFTGRINTLGSKTSASSTPVVLASDQAPLPVTDNGGSLTVDGSVAITSVIPGVGSTSLGKAEDAAAASGDTGIAMLGVYQPDTVGVSSSSIGDYATLNIDDKGRLRVSPGGVVIIDTFDSATGITAVNTDVTNIAVSTNHVRGTGAISFDVVNSAANSAFALIQKTIPAVNLVNLATGITFVQLLVFIPNISNVNNVVIRLGTDDSNYNSWSVSVANSSAVGGVWQSFRAPLGTSNASVGNGWDLSAITYYAVGLEFTNVNSTLAGVVVDSLWAIGGQVHGSDVNSEISSVVSTSKIDLAKVAGRNTDVDKGNSSTATLRVAIAADDDNLSVIKTNQTSGSQQTKITDGTNVAAVKAASTAAVVTDPALVVAISPNSTLPISATSLPLPTGAATEVTLATRLADSTFTSRVNTLGQKTSASSTPVVLASDQTAVPVSGTVTANIGTAGTLALNATLTGGTAKAIARGGAKGSTTAADVTSSASGANHQALDVAIYDAAGNQVTSFGGGGTQYADGVARGTATGNLLMVDDGTNIQSVSGDTTGRLNTNARVTDGTNFGTVKPASAAAVATDTALVVAVSPNNTVSVSAGSLPLPAGAATEATLATRLADATFTGRINTLGQKTSAASTPVVLASDQSALPVSGTVTSNIGTTNGLALDATLTGGTAKAIIRGGAKGSTAAADLTSTASGANHQPLDVAIYDAAGNQVTTFGGGSQYADGAARGTATGTLSMVDDGTNIQSVSGDVNGRINTNARITDGTNFGTVKPASSPALATDTALVVAVSPNSTSATVTPDVTATGALGALNAAVQIATSGIGSVGFQLAAGTLIGTILPEVSFDGGTTWVTTFLDDPSTALKANSVAFAAANTATARVVVGVGGAGHTRIRVSAYTSGTANITLRGSARPGAVLARYTTAGAGYSVLTSPGALALGITGQVTAYGTLKVSTEGSEIFTEPFDGTVVDTTNRWIQTLVGGATMTQGNGALAMTTGTTASNGAALTSQALFRPVGLSYQIFGGSVQLEATALTNNHRFWGLATAPGGWTAATPIQDGVGYEQDLTGALNAVVYAGGSKTTSLPIVRPVDGLQHRYAIYVRADLIYWYIDTLEVPVSGANFPIIGQQALPVRLHSINHTTPPASAPTFNLIGVAVSETSHSGMQISDGTFAWRKATVDTAGRLQVASAPASSPTSNQTNVASSASTVVLLAANAARKGATVFNDSASVLYLKLGSTASVTSFTTRMVAYAYYEVPFQYTGTIDGIWASATGSARMTELT